MKTFFMNSSFTFLGRSQIVTKKRIKKKPCINSLLSSLLRGKLYVLDANLAEYSDRIYTV